MPYVAATVRDWHYPSGVLVQTRALRRARACVPEPWWRRSGPLTAPTAISRCDVAIRSGADAAPHSASTRFVVSGGCSPARRDARTGRGEGLIARAAREIARSCPITRTIGGCVAGRRDVVKSTGAAPPRCVDRSRRRVIKVNPSDRYSSASIRVDPRSVMALSDATQQGSSSTVDGKIAAVVTELNRGRRRHDDLRIPATSARANYHRATSRPERAPCTTSQSALAR